MCEETLAATTACALGDDLAGKQVSGELSFHTIEEGLDKIAKLVGGKLVKEGEAYRITAK